MDRAETAPTGVGGNPTDVPRSRGIQDATPPHRALARCPDHGLRLGSQPIAGFILPAPAPGDRGHGDRRPESDIAKAAAAMAAATGVDACPEAVAAWAAFETLRDRGRIRPEERTLVFKHRDRSRVPLTGVRPSVRGRGRSRSRHPTRLNERAHGHDETRGKSRSTTSRMMSAWPSLTRSRIRLAGNASR